MLWQFVEACVDKILNMSASGGDTFFQFNAAASRQTSGDQSLVLGPNGNRTTTFLFDTAVQAFGFTANRLGRLHELVRLLRSRKVHVLALTVLDTSDSSIIRLVLDDPDKGLEILVANNFAYIESELLVVELETVQSLGSLIAALLEAELNINYLYSFIHRPEDKSIIGLSMEDNEFAENVLRLHMFKVLKPFHIMKR